MTKVMWYNDIEPIGECSEMQNGAENLNETGNLS